MSDLKLNMSVNEYINIIKEKPCLLDVVYQDTKSDSKDWLDNYSSCNSYLKKFLYYRFNVSDKIDIDSCVFIMPVYIVLSNKIIEKYKYSCSLQKKAGVTKAELEIKIDSKEDSEKKYLRGDTVINAMSAVQQLFEFIKNDTIEKPGPSNYKEDDFRKRYKEIVKLLEGKEEYKEILGLLNEHIKLCYSIGNFYPIMHKYDGGRRSLNNEKESCALSGRLSRFDDVMSEWLVKVKKCFFCEEGYDSRIRKKYSYWFEEYSSDWNFFLTENELMHFVEEKGKKDYTPKKYWKSESGWEEKEEFLTDFQKYLKEINASLEQRLNAVTNKVISENALERCQNLFNN